jgi:hypothetical protein
MDTTTQLLMVASLARSAAGGQTETKAEVNEHRTLVVFGKGFVPVDYTADKMHEYKFSGTETGRISSDPRSELKAAWARGANIEMTGDGGVTWGPWFGNEDRVEPSWDGPLEMYRVMEEDKVVDAVVAFRPGDVVKVNKAAYHYYPAGFMAIIVKPDGAEGHEWGARYEVRPLNPQGSLPDSQWIHAKDVTLF